MAERVSPTGFPVGEIVCPLIFYEVNQMSIFTKQNGIWNKRSLSSKDGTSFKPVALSVLPEKAAGWKPTFDILPLALAFKTATNETLYPEIWEIGIETMDPSGMVKVLNSAGDVVRTYPYQDIFVDGLEIEPEANGEVQFRGTIHVQEGTMYVLGQNSCITEILHIDPVHWKNSYPSLNSTVLVSVPPILNRNIKSLNSAFRGCSVFNQDLATWDVVNITNANACFASATSYNQPIVWNTSNLITAVSMLSYCTAFNQPLNNFNTSKLKTLDNMLAGCVNFNQPINFTLPEATSVGFMLRGCSKFNNPVVLQGASKLTNVSGLFADCPLFNQAFNLDSISIIVFATQMFYNCSSLNIRPTMNTNAIQRFDFMFQGATIFNQNIRTWNVTSAVSWANFRTGSALTTPNTPSKFV